MRFNALADAGARQQFRQRLRGLRRRARLEPREQGIGELALREHGDAPTPLLDALADAGYEVLLDGLALVVTGGEDHDRFTSADPRRAVLRFLDARSHAAAAKHADRQHEQKPADRGIGVRAHRAQVP
ncbi:MAG: hypothetical protein HY908_17960 [Myxococcales bacterium]|nr:hypothetical protein [Myxococcales bacterium]